MINKGRDYMYRRHCFNWIQNLSLHKKMLLIIIFSCLTLLAGNYTVLQMAYRAYDEQLYIKTAQVFTSFAEQIETEFEKMDNVALSMIGDNGIQNNLTILKNTQEGSQEWLNAWQAMRSSVSSYNYNIDFWENFGIHLPGKTHKAIGTYGNLDVEDRETLATKAMESGGASQIVIFEEQIFYIRQIRESRKFAFTQLGTIIGEINIEKLLNDLGELYRAGGVELDISVYVEDICIYQKGDKVSLLSEDGWEIQKDNFVVQCTMNRGWKFLMYTSYDAIHEAIRGITVNSFLIFALITMAVLLVGYFFVARITRHLDRLMKKFDAYGKGILPNEEEMKVYVSRKDELGRLHRHFDRMAYEYKQLNDENYNRMLLQKDAQYKLLQQQIHPHFIYNTLSLISWIACEHKDKEIVELTNALSRMMRKTLSFSEKTIPIKEELQLVEDYMLIQSKRYGKRLVFEINVPWEMEQIQIPQMTVQPIVENAVKYALEEMLEPCTIKIYGRIETEKGILIVEDNGFGIDENIIQKLALGEAKADGNGIGLQNIQKRIQLVFGEKYGLEFHRIEQGTQVWICIPLQGMEREKKCII